MDVACLVKKAQPHPIPNIEDHVAVVGVVVALVVLLSLFQLVSNLGQEFITVPKELVDRGSWAVPSWWPHNDGGSRPYTT